MKAVFKKFSRRERVLFFSTIGIIVFILSYIFILEPFYKRWLHIEDTIEGANLRLLKNLKLLRDKEALEKEYDKYKEYLQGEESEDQETASILKEVEATALGSGVAITSVKPKGIKKISGYKKYIVEVIAEAKMNQFLKFVYDLEGSKKLLKVERLILSVKSGQSDLLKGTLLIRKVSFPAK